MDFLTLLFVSETPWENKAVFMLYTELFIGFIKVCIIHSKRPHGWPMAIAGLHSFKRATMAQIINFIYKYDYIHVLKSIKLIHC